MKVSIIVPVYNMEKKLKKCIDSIINQEYNDIEIIIVNDGSTDNSLKIINQYDDYRIKLIDQKNMGISEARNNGLKIATGDFICFVDSDDYIEPNMIKVLVDKIKETNSDIVVCDYYIFDDNYNKEEKIVGNDSIFGKDLYAHPEMIKLIDFAPWNKIYKSKLFDDISFPKNTKYEDFDAILKVFSKAKKIEKVNESLYDYYVNYSGETRTNNKKNMDMLKIAKNLIEYFDFDEKDACLKDVFFEVCSEKLLHSCSSLFKCCDTKTCLKYIDDVYNTLNNNCVYWKKLYKKNIIDSKYIKFIRGNKIVFKFYAFNRTKFYKFFSR